MSRHTVLLSLLALSLVTTSVSGADGQPPRYRDFSGRFTLTLSQQIEVVHDPPVEASRDLTLDLEVATEAGGAVRLTVASAGAAYVAHGMKQRIGAGHLAGSSFVLTPADGGRRLEPAGENELAVDFGPPAGAFPIPGLLASILPELPDHAVAAGDSWSTDRPFLTLEGWAWVEGRLAGRQRVVQAQRGGAVLSIRGEASTVLSRNAGDEGVAGEMTRSSDWSFDVTRGRLLALSVEQKTTGGTRGPHGEMQFSQVTRVTLVPAG